MLSHIKINQSEIFKNGLHKKTDMVDWVIIHYLNYIERSRKQVNVNGSFYHKISLRELVHDIPLCGIQTISGMCKRLKRMSEHRLVALYRDEQNNLYFRLGYTARCILDLGDLVGSGVA